MIDFNHVSSADLYRLGIQFKTWEETKAFIALIVEELEVRVGEAVADGRTEKEMTMFEDCKSDDEIQAWLETYCPDYIAMIGRISRQLEAELIRYRDQIAGNIRKRIAAEVPEILSGPDGPQRDRSSSMQDFDRHISDMQKEKASIRELYYKGKLSESEREERIRACFKKGFIDFLDDRNLQIRVSPARWADFQEAFGKSGKDGLSPLSGMSWLVVGTGGEASVSDRRNVLKLMDVFHVPVGFFEPVPDGSPSPDAYQAYRKRIRNIYAGIIQQNLSE